MSGNRLCDLLGPYAAGESTLEERRRVEDHLEDCPRCRRELEGVTSAHDTLRRAAAGGAPPPDLKGWVMARASAEPGGGATSGARRWLGGAAVAAVLICALVGVYWTTVARPGGLPLTPTSIAPGASGELRGEEVGENLRVTLEVENLPALGEGEYYEMWYAKAGDGRLSCGTFDVGAAGDATVSMSAPASSVSYPQVEITREPADGDPGPSGDTVLVGDLRDL